jgi:predicted ATPase
LPRHETLNAMLDWSYRLLSEREKVVLCRLSVFVGDFTLQAASSVASETEVDEADVIDVVAGLVAKSLISTTVISESTYYRLLDTTRAYAANKLAERGEADRIARRNAIFYSNFLEHDEIIQSLSGAHGLSGYSPHIGNVRAMSRSASNSPPGRRACSSDCRCLTNAGLGANGHWPLSTTPAEAPDWR